MITQANDFEEYKKKLQKLSSPRHHKVKGSVFTKTIIRQMISDKIVFGLKESVIHKLIREVNKRITSVVCDEGNLHVPMIGEFYVVKKKYPTKLKNEKGKIARPIDWLATIALWAKDKEMEEKKFLVRKTDLYKYRVAWRKNCFKNHKYCTFKISRTFYYKLKEARENGKLFVYEKQ